MEYLIGIISALFAILLGLLGWEKRKTKKERSAREIAEAEVQQLTSVTKIMKQADQVKDDLENKTKALYQKKGESEKEIDEISEEKKHELSDDVKKLAAMQYHRSHTRHSSVLDDSD